MALKKIQECEKQGMENEKIVETVNELLKQKLEEEFNTEIVDPNNWSKEVLATNYYMEKNLGNDQQVMSLLKDFIDHQKVATIIAEVANEQRKATNFHMQAVEEHLEKHHQILMKVSTWKRRRLTKEKSDYESKYEEKYHNETVTQLQKEGLHAAAHLCKVEREFDVKHKEAEEKKFVKEAKIKPREETFTRKIWFSRNWIITDRQKLGHYRGLRWDVSKKYEFKVDQTLPFWRWVTFLFRTWCWMMNAMFFLLLVTPFRSRFSLRALLSPIEFFPDEFEHGSGRIRKKTNHRTRTLCSRLYDLWHHISKYRRKFESGPDTGLLGRNCSRPLNMIWNYFFKGLFGTVILLTVFPAICLTISLTSLAIGLTMPIIMPIFCLLVCLFEVFIYDFDTPHGNRRITPFFQFYFYLFIFEGILQIIFAVLSAFVFLPLCALLRFLFGLFWASSRLCWDKCCLYTVLKPRGRVPATNSWVAIRVSGPGLASHYLYQAKPQTILTALKLQVEMDLLEAYEKATMKQIEEPGKEFDAFFQQLRDPLYTSSSSVKPELRDQITYREKRLKVSGKGERGNFIIISYDFHKLCRDSYHKKDRDQGQVGHR